MAKYTWYFQVDNIKLKAKCKICTTLAMLKFSSTSKTIPFETAHRYVTPEEAAAAVDLLPLHTGLNGNPPFFPEIHLFFPEIHLLFLKSTFFSEIHLFFLKVTFSK